MPLASSILMAEESVALLRPYRAPAPAPMAAPQGPPTLKPRRAPAAAPDKVFMDVEVWSVFFARRTMPPMPAAVRAAEPRSWVRVVAYVISAAYCRARAD